MKILESTKIKVTKDKNGESVPHSEITEAVLVHCDIVKSIAFKSIVCSIVRYLTQKFYIFKNL